MSYTNSNQTLSLIISNYFLLFISTDEKKFKILALDY